MKSFFYSIAFIFFATTLAHAQGYTPQRVFDTREKEFTDFETMLLQLSRADVVFVGEQHNDPATHRLELALFEGISHRRPNLVLALEMFERDTQATVNDYLSRKISEEEFLKNSRPWKNYISDYRPLVEFAKEKKLKVIAGNVPRRYASQVAKGGLTIIDSLPGTEREWVAKQLQCPLDDDYYKKFSEVMKGAHPSSSTGSQPNIAVSDNSMVERMYQAQCVKDETMAESVASIFNSSESSKPLVIHYNGAFHSDYKLGAAQRTVRRTPKSSVKVVTIVPLKDLDNIDVKEYKKRGDYIVFTLAPAI